MLPLFLSQLILSPLTHFGSFLGTFLPVLWILGGLIGSVKVTQKVYDGTVLGAVTGAAAGLAAAASKGLNGVAQNQRKQNQHAMGQGTRFSGTRFIPGSRTLAKGINRATMGAALGTKGSFGLPTARGRAAVAARRVVNSAELTKDPRWMAIKENDDAIRAATYENSSDAQRGVYDHLMRQSQAKIESDARAQGWDQTRVNQEQERARAKNYAQARNAVKTVQATVGFGAPQQIAAAKAMSDTGTAFTDVEDVARTTARAARGNSSQLADMVGYINAASKKNRVDLTPGFSQLLEASQAVMDGKGVSQGNWDRMTVQGLRNSGSPQQIVATNKTQTFTNFSAASNRLQSTRAAAASGTAAGAQAVAAYGLAPDAMDDLEVEIISGAAELQAANYSSSAASSSAASFETILNRGKQIDARRTQGIREGQIRAYPQGATEEEIQKLKSGAGTGNP